MSDRREFLRRSGLVTGLSLSGLAASGCEPMDTGLGSDPRQAEILRALADVALPSELSEAERTAALAAFRAWLDEYRPAFERNHGYGTSEIQYGPADPSPGWGAQLQALDLEARQRYERGFSELEHAERERVVRAQLGGIEGSLGSPVAAPHVAVALMAHWFSSPEATDRCYGVEVGPRTCRGLEGVSDPPESAVSVGAAGDADAEDAPPEDA